ncbi:MAG: LysR family transcriptional regulator [Acidovorax sp.]|nr:LysR family transcriptional regulator [Acidovorax sp.]
MRAPSVPALGNPGEPLPAGPMLDLRRVRQFVVLAETLNFRRAAERLHIAQPPLSVSIQKLEAELGTRLFERGGAGGVSLTPSGQAALALARRLLFHNAQLVSVAAAAAAGTGGSLRIGFVGSTTHGALQRIVGLFRAEYPGVELVLKESTSVRIMERIEEGELDVGLVRTPLMASAQALLTPLLSEEFIAALPEGNPLAQAPVLKLRDLADESFVFYARSDAAGLQAMAMLACQLAGFLPRVTQEATQVQTVLSLVESGLGVALVPSIAQHTPNPHIAYRRIVDFPAAAGIGLALALRGDLASPAAQRFRDVAVRSFGAE